MSSSASRAEAAVPVARVERPHGLSGELNVSAAPDFASLLRPGARLLWVGRDGPREVEIEAVRPHGRRRLVRIRGVCDVESARGLAGGRLCVDREALAPPSPDFIFDFEVSEYECVDTAGAAIGRAAGFEWNGPACSLLVERGGRAVPIPFTYPIVRDVDRGRRRIVLDPPEGIFDL